MHVFIVLAIAVSLSMDAFSLALAYGTLNLSKIDIKRLSIIVGIYHFFMPLLGLFVGKIILQFIKNPDFIVFLVLSVIGIQMIFESFKKTETLNYMNITELLLFGLTVSIDSFSVGIGLTSISNHFVLCSCLFSFFSFFFTYLGLRLGKKINLIFGKISTLVGGIILILLGILYVTH